MCMCGCCCCCQPKKVGKNDVWCSKCINLGGTDTHTYARYYESIVVLKFKREWEGGENGDKAKMRDIERDVFFTVAIQYTMQ